MFARLRRSVSRFFNKSRKINHEPINKVSLIVIILVDLVILSNVFAGLNDISNWPMNPGDAYPCQFEWEQYRDNTADEKDYLFLQQNLAFGEDVNYFPSYRDLEKGRLGSVSEICLDYESEKNAISNEESRAIARQINDVTAEINSFTDKNNTIRQQYDSTLLEEIAGQSRERSINQVGAAEARQELERNEAAISQRETTLASLKSDLVNLSASQSFLALLNDDSKFNSVTQGYQRASFWYPSIQMLFKGLFLLPLILLALAVHRFAQRKNYGYIALISWHLLVIFCIPLILQIFEFLQFGFLIQWLVEFLEVLFGGLRFLINYLQILLIPIIGFGIIKFFQKVVFNTQRQAANRVQKMRCLNCAKQLRRYDVHCPHCGYLQYRECSNCNNLTYRHLPHCKHCGSEQPSDL
ncbi:MAG: hypothetical protein AAFU53_04780 [Cyanobacteria bacterium J06632_3]